MLIVSAAIGSASAQLTLTGTSYIQTFNSIGSGLPPGWSMRTNASATRLGTAVTSFTTNATSWGTTSGQFANYASTVSNYGTNFYGTNESTAVQAACTNRSVGMRQTGSFGDPGAAFVLQLQNTLGLAAFQLSVDLNLLSVQSRTNTWMIDYGIGGDPGSFTPVWTNTDSGVFGATTRTVSFGTALDNQAQNVCIRIVALDATTGTGSRDTFGIDNFRLSYSASGTVSPIPLTIQSLGGNVVLTWSNPSFALQAAAMAVGTYTNVPGAASPCTNPINGPQRFFRLKAN
jgi:hypothetical protein